MSMIAPCSHTSRFAGSKGIGRAVRKRSSTSSFFTPMIESHGPHMPTSVTKAVPFVSSRASAVWTWVWVPTTAETFPSRNHPIAFFSLVASQCMSTRMQVTPSARSVSTSASAVRNGSSSERMKTRPSRFTTPRRRPSGVETTARPRPGVPGG